MTDADRVNRLYRSAWHVTSEIQNFFGEMSQGQQVECIGMLIGFWCAAEDTYHPRPDGRSWKDVVMGMLKPMSPGSERQ